MKATIKKWGNGAAVRIPAEVMRTMHLELNEVVDVREEAGQIVMRRVRKRTYDQAELMKSITPKNRHEAVDCGPPSGKEVW